jgi:hypothetical protein
VWLYFRWKLPAKVRSGTRTVATALEAQAITTKRLWSRPICVELKAFFIFEPNCIDLKQALTTARLAPPDWDPQLHNSFLCKGREERSNVLDRILQSDALASALTDAHLDPDRLNRSRHRRLVLLETVQRLFQFPRARDSRGFWGEIHHLKRGTKPSGWVVRRGGPILTPVALPHPECQCCRDDG